MSPQLTSTTIITVSSWYCLTIYLLGHGCSSAGLGTSGTAVSIMSQNSDGYSEAFTVS